MVLHVLRGNRGCGSALRMPRECSGVLFGKFDSLRHRGLRGLCGGCGMQWGRAGSGLGSGTPAGLGTARAVQQGMGHRGHVQALALHVWVSATLHLLGLVWKSASKLT